MVSGGCATKNDEILHSLDNVAEEKTYFDIRTGGKYFIITDFQPIHKRPIHKIYCQFMKSQLSFVESNCKVFISFFRFHSLFRRERLPPGVTYDFQSGYYYGFAATRNVNK